ncbi:hypothetical protein [Rummeliibacillus stabekisii]|uniref:hypothetical protein n=1 Tax=Rummeliibacillus stabekisii TaxID=241244 RepID=UPI0011719F16|nr:hypothetical protein [Rummeliibacillus stabekisii]MBB5171411.1 hypothetical protein [Rummeliibacillus stabekisii]GEL05718.1 hypothetical protein RST01_23450 [Rummeliibacillus stabekisii]
MNNNMKKYLPKASLFLAAGVILAGCGNDTKSTSPQKDSSQPKQTESSNTSTSSNENTELKTLKNLSKDPDKNDSSEGDFDLVGKYVKENNDEITLEVHGKQIAIQKKVSFESDKKGMKGDWQDKQVVVEVSTNKAVAESVKPTDKTLADQDGVYDRDGDEKEIIGKLVKNDSKGLTLQTPNGNKTFQKTHDFELDDEAKSQNKLENKTVRIETDEHGKAEELSYSWIDQEETK